MYAIIDVGGKQIRVSPDVVGTPTVEGAKVMGEVVSHGKADKIIVYKYKRRKFYRRKRGHRQPFTEVKISKIVT